MLKVCKFQIRPIHPPLGDFHIRSEIAGVEIPEKEWDAFFTLCSFELLRLDCFSSSFFLDSNSIVTKERDTNCVVVLVGT